MPLECPQPGCSGHLEDLFCVCCGKTASLDAALYRFPTPDKIRDHENDLLDLAERGVT